MKHTMRKLLSLVLALATISALLTTALAANTDSLVLDPSHEAGAVVVSASVETPFFVFATVTNKRGVDVTSNYNVAYFWQLDNRSVSLSNYFDFPAKMEPEVYTLTCTVTAVHKTDGSVKTSSITWYVTPRQDQYDIDLTISQNQTPFYFTDDNTYSGTSVCDEIFNALDLRLSANLNDYLISFQPSASQIAALYAPETCTVSTLGDVYLSISGAGTWVTQYTVTKGDTSVLTGLLTIRIEPHVGVDSFYTAVPGESVTITSDEIVDFWYNSTTGGVTLQYVYIVGCSGMSGALCYDHSSTEKSHTTAFNLLMYADPANKNQRPLADLTFIPSKVAGKYPTGTVSISFSAVGVDSKKNPVTVNGSFAIFYANEHPETITYDCSASLVTLNGKDFDDVYRAVTGLQTTYPVYNIRFLDVPACGTLYRGYNTDIYGSPTSTPLTSSNISLLTFSSRAVGESSLNNLVYIPNTAAPGGDTVRYIAYSGTKILYAGTVSFTSREFVVTYTTSDPTVTFSSVDFYTSNSPLLTAQFIVFGAPSSGTLYKDYENGVRVQSYDYFSSSAGYGVNLLDNVTYVPKDGFIGLVEIPFAAQSFTGGAVSGKVRIYVVRNFFNDVDSSNWAAPYINRLYATGVINGTSATTFSPNENMTYGAALKMILLAAGYPKQSETGGTHWASNYLNLAYQKGIVSSKKIDLNAAVDRDTIAEIAAKALGLAKATSVNAGIVPPTDSTNGYVYALYNAGILNGSFVNGYNYFYGSKQITRAEVAKIICMINDYSK